MATLSIVLATYNEEKNLTDCLTAVRGLADEIVVVDGGSTDKTVEIGKSFGAKTIITTNPPIFHVNKQKAIDSATCDWVLQLDADERVTPELTEEIKSEILRPRRTKSEISGFWLPRKNWFLGRFLTKGGQYPDYTLRLFRRGKGKLPCQSVHEQAEVKGRVEYLKNPLIHMADINFSRYLLRWNRYVNLIKDELEPQQQLFTPIDYLFIKPLWWFLIIFIRHKGFMDFWQGFVFAFFSGFKFPVAYLRYLKEKYHV